MSRPSITRMVDELVRQGFVRRAADPIDGRGSILIATEDGLALWKSGQLRASALLAACIDALGVEERRQLELAMPLLARIMEPPAT